MKKSILFTLTLVLFASFGGYASYYYQHRPLHLLTTAEYPHKTPVIPFKLIDQYGHKFDNSNLKGKWTLFFVGYTSCPDICPTAMTKLAAAYPKLIKDKPFQVVFISVDPNRDTPDKLKQYTSFFNKKFIAVTGEQKQLLPLTRNLGMAYSLIGEGKNYQITHSATMTLVSPQGEKIAIVKPQVAPGKVPQIKNKEMVSDVEQLMSRYS